MGIKSSEQIPEKMEYDCRLTINRLGEFYLCIPRPLEIKADNQGPKFSVVEEKKGAGIISLDPGVRTFMTGYNPSGEAIEWGKGDINRMYRLCLNYDRIQSRVKVILFMANQVSIRYISSVDACSGSTRKFVTKLRTGSMYVKEVSGIFKVF